MTEQHPPRILLGVSGSIAAYKAAELVRRLRERGAEVQVVMTAHAREFISPLSLQALAGRPVRAGLFDPAAEAGMSHIALARWADQILIAPASANLIARLAHGLADDLLTTLVLASQAPVTLAPAMNQQMWAHPAVQDNIARLLARGVRLLGPDSGDQACGEVGGGRMREPAAIAAELLAPEPPTPCPDQPEGVQKTGDPSIGHAPISGPGSHLGSQGPRIPTPLAAEARAPAPLAGKAVLVTAGPTREALDPVRFIGNRSSGKMGYALAQALTELGAQVILVTGPTALTPPAVARVIRVESALEMHAAVMDHIAGCAIFAAAAAVADYRPEDAMPHKLKKNQSDMQLRLVRNPDILAEVAARDPAPFTLGFAAETEALEANARDKLERKKLSMVAANLVAGEHGGFERDDNALVLLWRGGQRALPLMPKHQAAREIARTLTERYAASA